LAARRLACEPEALRRAEAAARPGYSQRLFVEGIPEATDLFHIYLLAMLEKLDVTACVAPSDLEALTTELRTVLRPDGRASSVWKMVMPRVPEALGRLRNLGLKLVVVSNSDGTVEQSLIAAGLRPYLSAVIDSAIAGHEKPDPRIFTHALDICGARPERTLHVGDIYHAGVRSSIPVPRRVRSSPKFRRGARGTVHLHARRAPTLLGAQRLDRRDAHAPSRRHV